MLTVKNLTFWISLISAKGFAKLSLQRRGSSKSRKRRNKKRNKASDSRNEGSQELLPQDQPKEKPRTSKNSKRGLEQKENGHSNNSDNQNGREAEMVGWGKKEKKKKKTNKQTTEHSMPFYLSRLVHFVMKCGPLNWAQSWADIYQLSFV